MKKVICDFSDLKGKIKPQHGFVNFPEGMTAHYGNTNYSQVNPDTGSLDAAAARAIDGIFREIAMPMVRLKDPKSFFGKMIDIPYVFRDFRKDPDDPESWYFYRNDPYLKSLDKWPHGDVMIRLGAPREQWAPIYNNKPSDYDKFTKLCLNFIRHVNEDWADGLQLGIKYWEIWDRADDPRHWSKGTIEDYYELYGKVSRAIKDRWPDLKVGGPSAAFCGGDNAFLKGFLSYVKSNDLPCDFVTWNYYGEDPEEALRQAREVKEIVRASGLPEDTRIFNTAWNCMTEGEDGYFIVPNVCNMHGAAFGAAFMINMQKAGMDASTYYECVKSWAWGGLVQPQVIKAYKPLYSFLAFSKLYKHGKEAYVKTSGKNMYALAASDEKGSAVLVSLMQDKRDEIKFETGCTKKKAVYVLDEGYDFIKIMETEDEDFSVKTEGYTVIYIETE